MKMSHQPIGAPGRRNWSRTKLIRSRSPQARAGWRLERLFSALQDRLVKVLRRAGVVTFEEADRAPQKYLPRLNARFALEPADPDLAYPQWPTGLDPS